MRDGIPRPYFNGSKKCAAIRRNLIATLTAPSPMTVQCGGCAVTGNANERGTPLSANPLFALVPADSNDSAKTAGAESSLRMQLAILFLCVLFSFFYVSGLGLIVQIWLLSSRRPDAFARPAKRESPLRSKAA